MVFELLKGDISHGYRIHFFSVLRHFIYKLNSIYKLPGEQECELGQYTEVNQS